MTNGTVDAIASSGTGSVFLGGSFDYIGPLNGAGAAIGTTNGALSLALGVNGKILAAVADGSGGVFIGGEFTQVGGVARSRLAHILANGTVDPAWNPGADGPVHALTTNGVAVWVGGLFTTVAGQPRTNLAQVLVTDGSATTFVANTNPEGTVRALALFTSTLVVGGDYTSIGGSVRRGLSVVGANTAAVLHPVADVVGGQASVRAFALIGTTIYVGGDFTHIRDGLGIEVGRQNIAAFDGGVLTLYPWNPGADKAVEAVATDGTTIWAGGDFEVSGGASRRHLASYTASTTTSAPLNAWNPGVASTSGAPRVETLTVVGSTVYAGGTFTAVGGQPRKNLAAVHGSTGALDGTWTAAAGGTVLALENLGGGKVYAGGDFKSVGGGARRNLAELSLATGTATAWRPDVQGAVRDLAVLDGTVYAAGSFTMAGGSPRDRLAAFDASTGALRAWNPGADATVEALAVEPGAVYAGGAFSQVGGQSRAGLARIGTDGVVHAFAPAASGGAVHALALAPLGTELYVGGAFATLAGAPRSAIGAVDSASGVATAWNPGADGPVRALAATSQAVYAGGSFGSAGGQPRSRLAALDPGSGAALAFRADADAEVRDLALSPTALYATGAFTSIGGTARGGLAGLDGRTGAVTTWNPAFAPSAGDAVATAGEDVVAGSAVASLSAADRGAYLYDTSSGSGLTGVLRCGRYEDGAPACLEARFPDAYAWGALAPGTRTSTEQALQVISNRTWGLSAHTDATDGRLREWDGSAYVPAGRSLASPVQAAVTRLGTPVTTPSWSALSSSPSALLASAAASNCTSVPETCGRTPVGVTLKQPVSFADQPLDSGNYRVTVTYDVAQPF